MSSDESPLSVTSHLRKGQNCSDEIAIDFWDNHGVHICPAFRHAARSYCSSIGPLSAGDVVILPCRCRASGLALPTGRLHGANGRRVVFPPGRDKYHSARLRAVLDNRAGLTSDHPPAAERLAGTGGWNTGFYSTSTSPLKTSLSVVRPRGPANALRICT